MTCRPWDCSPSITNLLWATCSTVSFSFIEIYLMTGRMTHQTGSSFFLLPIDFLCSHEDCSPPHIDSHLQNVDNNNFSVCPHADFFYLDCKLFLAKIPVALSAKIPVTLNIYLTESCLGPQYERNRYSSFISYAWFPNQQQHFSLPHQPLSLNTSILNRNRSSSIHICHARQLFFPISLWFWIFMW